MINQNGVMSMSGSGMDDSKKQQKIEEVLKQFAQKSADMEIESNIFLDEKQVRLLKQIHVLAINRALHVAEVRHDPRKIVYYANDELKLGLAAILMTHVLINHMSSAKYTEDFFLEHIVVYTDPSGHVKHVDLTDIEQKVFNGAMTDEIVYDWIIYRSPESRGIRALSDEKTEAQGIEGFSRGMSPVSEFSRFERKYYEKVRKKAKDDRQHTQQAFRSAFVREIAQAAAKQLLDSQDPMTMAKLLFATKDYEKDIEKLLQDLPVNREIDDLSKQWANESKMPAKKERGLMDALDANEKTDLLLLEMQTSKKNHIR
ncbi:MAG: hypothetical protein J6X42_04765 [Alphaproteobacteria bacterium]|nr:hypothetical protein [Alphaproteobacteria bacterium]